MKGTLYLIIHDVRSAHNVGSLFRTADGLGVSKIYLTGYTPAPIDRFGRRDAKISKVSLGAEGSVPWEKAEIQELIQALKKERVEVVALEQTSDSIPLCEYRPTGTVALIVGNEVDGIPEDILVTSDVTIEIPMRGKLARNRLPGEGGKESLNVSNAGAIALYAFSHAQD